MRKKIILAVALATCSASAEDFKNPQAYTPEISVGGTSTIYSNGRMQAEVFVDVILNENPTVNWVKLYSNDTATPELLDTISGWNIDEIENEYNHYVHVSTHDEPMTKRAVASSYTRYRFWVTNDSGYQDSEEICAAINITRSDTGEEEEITSCRQNSNNAHANIYATVPVSYTGIDFEIGADNVWVNNQQGYRVFENLKRKTYVPDILYLSYSDDQLRSEIYTVNFNTTFMNHFYKMEMDPNVINQAFFFLLDVDIHKQLKYMQEASHRVSVSDISYISGTRSDPYYIRTIYTWQFKNGNHWRQNSIYSSWTCSFDEFRSNGDFYSTCGDYNNQSTTFIFYEEGLTSLNRSRNHINLIDVNGNESMIQLGISSGRAVILN